MGNKDIHKNLSMLPNIIKEKLMLNQKKKA